MSRSLFFIGDYMEPEELEKKLLELDEAVKASQEAIKAKDEELAKMKERNDQLVERLLIKQEPPELGSEPEVDYAACIDTMAEAVRDRYIKQD